MHSLCLLESVSRADGGIFEAELGLQRELVTGQGIRVDVLGLEDRYTEEDLPKWHPIYPRAIRPSWPALFGYAPDLTPSLDPKADLLYAATLWKYPSWAALQWSERTNKPMIVAPHGSLDPWALHNAAWKKQIAATLFKNRQLHKATCLRALCQSEAESFRKYGLKNPIANIPNGVHLPDEAKGERLKAKSENKGRKTLLFLGRIHPKKGLLNLVQGFKKALDSRPLTLDQSWQLVIAGWDQGGHEAEIMELCKVLGMSVSHKMHKNHKGEGDAVEGRGSRVEVLQNEAEVIFWGPAFGDEKKMLLSSVDAFVLPSLSEGLPMAVLEAWAYGLPVVMTPECNLPEGFAVGGAIRIGADVQSIDGGLKSLFSMNESDLYAMGSKGMGLVEQRFTWQAVAAQMHDVYDWMLGGGDAPVTVNLN